MSLDWERWQNELGEIEFRASACVRLLWATFYATGRPSPGGPTPRTAGRSADLPLRRGTAEERGRLPLAGLEALVALDEKRFGGSIVFLTQQSVTE